MEEKNENANGKNEFLLSSAPLNGGNGKDVKKCENGESPLSLFDENVIKESENGEHCSSSLVSQCDEKVGDIASLMKGKNGFFSNLKENEKAALVELRSKVEDAILANKLFKEEEEKDEPLKQNLSEVGKEEGKCDQAKKSENGVEINKEITLWGVPLLPSNGNECTDVLLFKFLTAREFKVNDAFEMLRNTLEWRRENNIDSIMEEDFGDEFASLSYMLGLDREGHLVCYNLYGVFADDEVYNKTFGTEASREKFLRWRLQLMEKQIRELDFKADGVSSLVQIHDLKNTPGPSRRDLRHATKRAVEVLQDNYPEFVARNIFINVPFWYYAFNALLSPFLTQRTKSKIDFSRPSRVTETLLKYIAAEEIPVYYGGLRRENDTDFSVDDAASDVTVKAGATETIEIFAPEVGATLIWDLSVIGWDVNYKEEFVPDDEGSYTVIVRKGSKISCQDESIRNTFTNNEPGKVVITIENGIFRKKRVLYRYKTNNSYFHKQ